MFSVEVTLRLMSSLVADDGRANFQAGFHRFGTALREWATDEFLGGAGHTFPNAQRADSRSSDPAPVLLR